MNANNKVAATVHPSHPGGYIVNCEQCGPDLFKALFYDVAERFADLHEDAKGHNTDVAERKPADG
jgi:hypothetical protein